MVATFGSLLQLLPEHILQLSIGILLLLFGGNWLRKAVLRAAGRKALHDEAATFDAERATLSEQVRRGGAVQWLTTTASFKAVLLEGIEVVFIVLSLSTRPELLLPVSASALAATALVAIAGYLVHRPLTRVPENTLKFAVGVSLTAFGVYWLGEGLGFVWPGGGLAIVGLLIAILLAALAAVQALRR